MKKFLRILCLVLALSFVVTAFAACGGKPAETTTRKPIEGDVPDKWKDVNFEGETLRIWINDYMGDTDARNAGADVCLDYMRGVDEDDDSGSNTVLVEATDRYDKVLNILGLENGDVEYTMAGWKGNCDSILPDIQALNTANAKDGPSIIIHENYGMVRAGITGLLYNVYDNDQTNYFDLTEKGWYLDMMEENTIDKNKIYMLLGDFFIDQFRMAYGVLANTTLIEERYRPANGSSGMDALFEHVLDGTWTYETMLTIADACRQDTGGNWDSASIMGVIGSQWCVRSFFSTSGLDVFQKDASGKISYITDIADVHDWIDTFINMEKQPWFSYNWVDTKNSSSTSVNPNRETASVTFANGRAAFAIGQAVVTFESALIQNMSNNCALLPNPRYFTEVESTEFEDVKKLYGALTSDNANSGGILINAKGNEFTLASAFLQLMAENSESFMEEYYETNLMIKVNQSDSQQQIQMIQIIHDGICSPMSMLYDNYCSKSLGDQTKYMTYAALMYKSLDPKSNTFASDWKGQLNAKTAQWDKIVANFGNMS